MRVLVVDDTESNRTIVEQYLGSWKMKADSAENGLQAITKIREAARSGEPYDLVVLDCGMPGMSGIDVARLITADHKIAATPLIMLTSYDDRNEMKAAKDVDIRALLTKPVRKQMLRKAIIKAVAPKPSVPVAVGGQVERPKPPKTPILQPGGTMLLVEDNEDNQKLAVRLLAKHGFDCDIASNGLEAVTKFAEQSYSMVLMDCQMPVMDGFAATIAMRKEEQRRPRRTAIIAMTAHALPEDREKCLSAGMDDYLSKPINEHHLVDAIRRWLPPVEAVLESAKPSEMIPVTGGGIDTKIQIRAKPGVSDLIPSYLSNRQHDLVSLAQAVNRGDLPAARLIGHGMKGSGAGYGFPAISEIGRSIEQCAISEDTAGIMRQISSLEEYLTRVEVVY
jgi:CheY-like chemotaxis protein